MVKRTHLEAIYDKNTPTALIVSGGDIGNTLFKALKDKGLIVDLISQLSPAFKLSNEDKYKRYDYIIHFGKINQLDDLVKNHLDSLGRLIFIERDLDTLESIDEYVKHNIINKSVKIIRIGSIASHKNTFLLKKIQRVLFSESKEKVVDIRSNKLVEKAHKQKHVYSPYNDLVKTSAYKRINLSFKKPQQRAGANKKKKYKAKLHGLTDMAFSLSDFAVERKPVQKVNSEKHSPSPPTRSSGNGVKEVRFNRRRILLILLIVAPVTLFIISSYRYINSVKQNLLSLKHNFATSDVKGLENDLKKTENLLTTSRQFYNITTTVLFPLRHIRSVQDIGSLFNAVDDVVEGSLDMIYSSRTFFNDNSSFFASSQQFKGEDMEGMIRKMKILQGSLNHTKKKLDRINIPYFPKDQYLVFLDNFEKQLREAFEISQMIKLFLFNESTKTYLILFQNNMELRPTGGFIGSFGLLTMGEGKIHEFKIYDVYTADGQLKGHVDPPEPIRKYLSQPHFFLRDSNFDPDFAFSAQKASFFLEKELGLKVDGVMGVNLFFIQDILKVIGPIKIVDFNREEIDADNFLFKMQLFATRDFFPGSSEKKDFLSAIYSAILTKIDEGGKLPWFEILSVVKKSLDKKNILIYSSDKNAQEVIEKTSWGGRLPDVMCINLNYQQASSDNLNQISSCLPDYLSIIEANLGVNKANYFVSKKIDILKNINNAGSVENILILTYKNEALSEIFSDVIYTNYLRIFTPSGSELKEVYIDDNELNEKEIDIVDHITNKTSFGFLLKVKPKEKRVVKITYELPGKITSDILYYQFFFQKQGGDKTSSAEINFTYPSKFTFSPINFKPQSKKEGRISLTTDTSVDRIFAFRKK